MVKDYFELEKEDHIKITKYAKGSFLKSLFYSNVYPKLVKETASQP